MPWYVFSLVALFFTGWYSIAQKWALNLGIKRTQLLTYSFIGLFLCYFFYGLIINHGNFAYLYGNKQFYLWGLYVALFSMLGNISQMKALKTCPNPGYISSIVAVQALVIMILSWIFFRSPIYWAKLVGMLVLLAGLYGLLIDKTKSRKRDWQLPSFAAMIFWSVMYVGVKEMTNLGFEAYQILTVLFFFASIGFVILSRFEHISLKKNVPTKVFWPILLAVLVAFFFNLLNFIALKLVPNPGYSAAVSNAGVLLTLLFSYFVFPKEYGGEFNLRKWASVLVIMLGTTMIILL